MDRYKKIDELVADYLVERQQQLLADLNYQLIVDTELKHCIYGKVLWVESISVVRLPEKCNPYTSIDQGLCRKCESSCIERRDDYVDC